MSVPVLLCVSVAVFGFASNRRLTGRAASPYRMGWKWCESTMKRCHKCGAEWRSEKRQPGVKEFCSACTAYLHCCKNCRFHDPNAHNQCRIPTTEWVGDRHGANFCDEFEFVDRDAATGEDKQHDQARAKLERLLGGDSTTQKQPKTLDDLFGH